MNLIRPLFLLVLLGLPRLGMAQKLIVGKGIWIPTEKGTYNLSVDDSLYFRLTSRTLGTLPARIKASSVVGLTPQFNRKANQSDIAALGIQPGSRNQYNYATATPGIYQDNLGVFHTDSTFSLSFRIDVIPGHTYYPSNKQYIVFLDSSEVVLSSTIGFYNRSTTQVVAPARARYARLTIPNSLLTTFQFWDGATPTTTEPYSLSANLTTPQATSAQRTATLAQANARYGLGQVHQSWNLFDLSDVAGRVMGKYVSQLSIEVVDPLYFITPYIPIRADIPHIESHKQLIAYYGAPDPMTGIPVSLSVGELSTRASNSFTPPEGAEFMRLTVAIANLNTFMVGEGTTLPGSYVPYSRVLAGETQGSTAALTSATTTAALLPTTANILSPATSVTVGYYSTDTGTRVASAGFAIMGPIKVKPSTVYHTDFGTNPPTDPQYVTYLKADGTIEGGVPYSRGTHSFTTTANTASVILTTGPSLTATTQLLEGGSSPRISYGRMLDPGVLITTGTNGLFGIITGTSILWNQGYSYWQMAGESLGMYFVNSAVPSSRLRAFNKNGSWTGEDWHIIWSLTQTLAEKDSIIANWNSIRTGFTGSPPTTLTPTDTAYIRNTSYQRSVIPYLSKSSVLVIGHAYNDKFPSDSPAEFTTANSSRSRNTFIGAFNFFMDEVYKTSPNQPAILDGHYENKRNPEVVTAQLMCAERWNIPIARNWERTGWTNEIVPGTGGKTKLQVALPDEVHPYSDTTGKAVNVMVKLAAFELRRLFPPIPTN